MKLLKFVVLSCQAIALSCSALPFQVAHAATTGQAIENVFGSVALPCTSEATRLLNHQLFRLMPDLILNSMRRLFGKPEGWSRGDANYEKVRAVVLEALIEEQRRAGPIYNFSVPKLLGNAVSAWNADEQRYFSSFFSSRAGTLYLTDSLERVACMAWLKGVNAAPFLPLEGEDKTHWETLLARLDDGGARFDAGMQRLSKAEKQLFWEGVARLGNVFGVAIMGPESESDPEIVRRITAALSPRFAEIHQIATTSQ